MAYTGTSIVDYLKSTGAKSDFASRTVLATKSGIKNYTGTTTQNTQLLGILNKAPATTKINTAITPAGLIAPINPTVIQSTIPSPIVDASTLTASTVAQQKLDAQMVADRKAAEAELAKNTKTTESLESIIGTLGADLATKGTAQLSAEDTAEISSMSKEKAAIDARVITGIAEYEQLKTEYDRVSLENRNKPITMNSIIGAEAAIDFARSQKLNSKATDIGLLQAQSLGKAGQIDAAQKVVDRAIDLKYADKKALLDVKTQQLTSLYSKLTSNEKKVADLVKQRYDSQQKEIDDQKAQEKLNFTTGQSYAKLALEGGQSSLASKLSSLDVSSPTYTKDLAYLQAQILNPVAKLDIALKQAQIANEKASTIKIQSETGVGGKPPTDTQIQNAGYADRMQQANTIIDLNAKVFQNMTYIDFKLVESKSQFANLVMSPEVRQASQAMRNFITAKLRKESGAAIAPSEFDDARLQYFPALGDDVKTLEQKKVLRDSVLKNLIQGSGTIYKETILNPTDMYFNTTTGVLNKIGNPIDSKEYNFLSSLGL